MRSVHRFQTWVFAAAGALLLALSVSAVASPLVTGSTLFPSPAEPDPIGGAVVGSVTAPFSAPTFSGSLKTTVLSGDTSNPFPGGLTFVYQLINDATSTTQLARLSLSDFSSFKVDASYQVPAVGVVPPAVIDRNTDDVIGFSFLGAPLGPGAIGSGKSSSVLVLQTDATTFTDSRARVIDGSTAEMPTLAPRAGGGVPEPASVGILGSVLAGLALRRRRHI
jgi:hypothetical protein